MTTAPPTTFDASAPEQDALRSQESLGSRSQETLDPPRPEPVDDAMDGTAMFLIFTSAVLGVTGAVALVAFIGTWWVLGVTFAFHIAMTTIVIITIVRVMAGRGGQTSYGSRPAPRPVGVDAAHRRPRTA